MGILLFKTRFMDYLDSDSDSDSDDDDGDDDKDVRLAVVARPCN